MSLQSSRSCLLSLSVIASVLLSCCSITLAAPADSAPAGSAGATGAPTGDFRVMLFTPPSPVAPAERDYTARRADVTVVFSADAVSTQAMQTMAGVTGVISFEPAVEGFARWENPRTLRYAPRSGFKPCSQYTARIRADLRDVTSRTLTGQTAYPFRTPPLTLTGVDQNGFTADRRATISLKFNDEIVPADLQTHLSFKNGSAPLAWKLVDEKKTRFPQIVTDPITTAALSVHLTPGLTGASGPLGLETAVDREIPLTFRLTLDMLSARWQGDKVNLVARFSSGVRLENLRDYMVLSPATQFEVSSEGNRVVLTGDFKPEKRYSLWIRDGLRGSDGQLFLGETTQTTVVPRMVPFMDVLDAGGHLSSDGQMRLRVKSSGVPSLHVRTTRLFDNNLVYYLTELGSRSRGDRYRLERLGTEVAERDVPVAGAIGAATTTEVDLRDAFGKRASGLYLVEVSAEAQKAGETDSDNSEDSENGSGHRVYGSSSDQGRSFSDQAVIAASNLGIVGKRSGRQLTTWLAGLDTARPLDGVHVRVYTAKNQLVREGDTDASGLITFEDLPQDKDSQPAIVIASKGDDISYLDLRKSLAGDEAFASDGRFFLGKGYEAFLSPERGAYRPGETVHLFGSVRGRAASVPAAFPMEMQIERPDNRFWEPVPVTISEGGCVTLDVAVPPYAPTGLYHAHLQMAGTAKKRATDQSQSSVRSSRSHDYDGEDGDSNAEEALQPPASDEVGQAEFYVEDFMPNRLKVQLEAPERIYSTSEPLAVTVKASEMFGQPAAGRDFNGTITYYRVPFSPRGYSGFTFGTDEEHESFVPRSIHGDVTGADGQATVTVSLPSGKSCSVIGARVQITVKDIGGRGVSGSLSRQVATVPYFIGLSRQDESYPAVKKEAKFDIAGVLPDGTRVDTASLTGTISRVRYNCILKKDADGDRGYGSDPYYSRFHYVSTKELTTVKEFETTLSAGRAQCAWTPSEAGQYEIRVADSAAGTQTVMPLYVSSPYWVEQPWSLEKPERLDLVLDKKEYRPGEKARLLVKAPFAGTLLLSMEQDRVLSTTIVEMKENTQEVEVPLDASCLPNVYFVATVIHPVRPVEKWFPHRAYGMVNVPMSSKARELDVSLSTPVEVRPRSPLTISLSVRDVTTSAPVPSKVTVWAVDEGVLSLTGFTTPDPLDFFYAPRRLMVATADFFSELMPEIAGKAKEKSSTGGGNEDLAPAERKRQSPVATERVKPVSLWLGTMSTDKDGKATATFNVPQFIGQVRVMAVASSGPQFGKAEAQVFVRSPLMVKENLPRFMAPGDEARVPLVIYNNTDKAQVVSLAIETSGALESGVPDADGLTAEVQPHGSATRHVILKAAPRVGQALFRYATMGNESFQDEVKLPVRPANPYAHFADLRLVSAGETMTLASRTEGLVEGTSTGTLMVSDIPTVRLAGGLNYLVHYPYGCVEQTASSAFPLIYLQDLARQVDPQRFQGNGIEAKVQAGIDRVLSMQVPSGGLSMWPGGTEPWPWGTIYATHFLVEAQKAGYAVPELPLHELMTYLNERLKVPVQKADVYSLNEQCYTLYVLALAGKRNIDRMEALYERRGDLNHSSRALLACAYMLTGGKREALELLGATDSFDVQQTERDTGGILNSPVRETAMLLVAALETNSSAAEVPMLVKRLEERINHEGHWGTTQDNAFALWALGRYAKKIAQAPQAFEGTVEVAGKSVNFKSGTPLTLPADPTTTAIITVRGPGHAYVMAITEGVPVQPLDKPESHGMSISRRFTDRAGRKLDPNAFVQGDLIMVDVVVSGAGLQNVVVEDLLPAGLEIENAHLQTSENAGQNSSYDCQTDPRDDRMIAYIGSCSGYTLHYAVRAVTPGTFVLPPAQASCMYDPDIYARTASSTVRVVEK